MYSIISDLRKESLSLHNRLQLVIYDSKYISTLDLPVPTVANERCGLWYCPDHHTTCYFKLTDGHNDQWAFSQRRLNLHLFDTLRLHGGMAIVDSTRKGKLMPDALSKTIPIWIAVMNGINPNLKSSTLVTSEVVSPSIHSQIDAKIAGFVETALRLNLVPMLTFDNIAKPMVPIWVYPGKQVPPPPPDCYPVYLITASHQVKATQRVTHEGSLWYYVQGSGDDHELWATAVPFLSPMVFWDIYPELAKENGYLDEYLSSELVEMIKWIHQRRQNKVKDIQQVVAMSVGETGISFAQISQNLDYERVKDYHQVIVLSKNYRINGVPDEKNKLVLQFTVDEGKKGAKQLREMFPDLIPKITLPVLIMCDSGKDHGIGVVLVLLCQRFNLDWQSVGVPPKPNKDVVKQHLAKIPGVNPLRNTLQSVNSYIM